MKKMFVPVLVLSAVLTVPVAAQAPAAQQPDREKVLRVAASIMRAAGFCALITIGDDGQPQSRVMQPQPPDEQFVVWMGTNPLTRKVTEIERNPRVTLSYFDKPGNRFVTLLGEAAIVRDAVQKAAHWTDDWSPFYKDKYRGDDFMLLKVTPSRLEVVSATDGIQNDPRTWKPTAVLFSKK